MSTVPFPTVPRTELEVAADTIQALFRARVLPADGDTVARVCDIAGITLADLREAVIRWEGNRGRRPRNVWTGHAPAPTTPARVALELETEPAQVGTPRRCRRCKIVKPLDDFPLRRGRPDGRSQWCRPCSEERAATDLEARRVTHTRAALTFTVTRDHGVVGMRCEFCDTPIRPGDRAIVAGEPHHETCPQ